MLRAAEMQDQEWELQGKSAYKSPLLMIRAQTSGRNARKARAQRLYVHIYISSQDRTARHYSIFSRSNKSFRECWDDHLLYPYTCIPNRSYVLVYTYIHSCKLYTSAHINSHSHVHMHTKTNTHANIYKHTHIRTLRLTLVHSNMQTKHSNMLRKSAY